VTARAEVVTPKEGVPAEVGVASEQDGGAQPLYHNYGGQQKATAIVAPQVWTLTEAYGVG
jgi:hypothetical protein